MNREQNALNFMLYLLDDPWILTAMRGELTEEFGSPVQRFALKQDLLKWELQK